MLKGLNLSQGLGLGQSQASNISSLSAFLARRIQGMQYMRKCARGETYFMNACILSPNDIVESFDAAALGQLTKRYALLSLSIGRILTLSNIGDIVRASAQLMAEYEHYAGDTIVPDAILSLNFRRGGVEEYYPDSLPSHKGESALPSSPLPSSAVMTSPLPSAGISSPLSTSDVTSPPPTGAATEKGEKVEKPEKAEKVTPTHSAAASDPVKTTLHTAGGTVVYEYMQVPNIPFTNLDFMEVLSSMIDMLVQMYSTLQQVEAYASISGALDSVYKMDRRIKHYFIKPITLQMMSIATKKMQAAFSGVQAKVVNAVPEPRSAADGAVKAADADSEQPEPLASPTITLAGGLLYSTANAVSALRAAAENQLSALAGVAGTVAALDSSILCGILPGAGEASRDLSADFVEEDVPPPPEPDNESTDPKRAKRGSLLKGIFGEKKPGGKGGLLSSKPPAEPEVAKVHQAARQQLGAYFGGASGFKAEIKRT